MLGTLQLKKEFIEYLKGFLKIRKGTTTRPFVKLILQQAIVRDYEELEGGFFDGFFHLHKSRELLLKSKEDILSKG